MSLADSDASMAWAGEEDSGPLIVDPAIFGQLGKDLQEEDYILLKGVTQTGKKRNGRLPTKLPKCLHAQMNKVQFK